MAGIVAALTDGRAGELGERGAGVSCPGLEGEGAAVKDVPAALPGDEGVQGGKGASLAGSPFGSPNLVSFAKERRHRAPISASCGVRLPPSPEPSDLPAETVLDAPYGFRSVQ
jgi:hypothetical protein